VKRPDRSGADRGMQESAPADLTGTVIRGVGLAGSGYAMTQVLRMAVYVVLARVASPSDFGELAAGMILVGVGILFAESGMLGAVVQRRDRVEEAASTAFFATLLAGVCFSLGALALSPVIGLLFHSGRIGAVAAAMSGYLLLRELMIVPEAIMQRRFSFLRRLVLEPTGAVVFGATAIVACSNGMGVWGLVLGTYASLASQVVLSWILIRWRPRPALASIAMWRELVRFGRHVIAGEVLRRATAEVPTLLLGRFVGPAALGQFQYAFRVAGRPLATLVSSTSYVLFPAFARISEDRTRFRRAFLRSLRWVCVISFPLSLLLFPLGEPGMVLVFGDPWQQAGEAMSLMCAYTAAHVFVSLAGEVFKAAGRPELIPRLQLLGTALTVGFMLALLPFGLLGIAVAVSLRSTGMAIYAVRATGGVLELPTRRMLADILPPGTAALIMAGALYCLDRLLVHAGEQPIAVGLLLLAGEALLGLVAYLGILCVLAPSTRRELGQVPGWARRRLTRRRAAHGEPAPVSSSVA
jgi:O-antigen/teichoic acid export membrane protein